MSSNSFPKTLVSIFLARWPWLNPEIEEILIKRLSRSLCYHLLHPHQDQMMIQPYLKAALILHRKKENLRKRARCLPNSILMWILLSKSLKSKMSLRTFPLVNPIEWLRSKQTLSLLWVRLMDVFSTQLVRNKLLMK